MSEQKYDQGTVEAIIDRLEKRFGQHELPAVGDGWWPVFMTDGAGVARYGAEVVWVRRDPDLAGWECQLVLCFHEAANDAEPWQVVAVLDESALRRIARYVMSEVL